MRAGSILWRKLNRDLQLLDEATSNRRDCGIPRQRLLFRQIFPRPRASDFQNKNGLSGGRELARSLASDGADSAYAGNQQSRMARIIGRLKFDGLSRRGVRGPPAMNAAHSER